MYKLRTFEEGKPSVTAVHRRHEIDHHAHLNRQHKQHRRGDAVCFGDHAQNHHTLAFELPPRPHPFQHTGQGQAGVEEILQVAAQENEQKWEHQILQHP